MPQVIHCCTYLQRTFVLPLDPAGYGCRVFHRLHFKREILVGAQVGTQYEADVYYSPLGSYQASFTYNFPNPPASVDILPAGQGIASFNGPNQLVEIIIQGGEAAIRHTYTVSDPVDVARPVERATSLVDQVNLEDYPKPVGIVGIRSFANPLTGHIDNPQSNIATDWNRTLVGGDETFTPRVSYRGQASGIGPDGLFSNFPFFNQLDPQTDGTSLAEAFPYASAGSGLIIGGPAWWFHMPDESPTFGPQPVLILAGRGPDLIGRYVRSKVWPFRNWCLTTWPSDGFGQETCIVRNTVTPGNCSTRTDTGPQIILPGSEGDWRLASDTRLFYNAFIPDAFVDVSCSHTAARCA